MKTILLCFIASVFFNSCTTDSDFETIVNWQDRAAGNTAVNDYPANTANPYDGRGKKIYDMLNEYYQKKNAPNSISELGEQIRFTSGSFDKNNGLTSRLIPFTDQMVQSIMQDPDSSMISIVQNSILQNYAKTNLINFLEELIIQREQEFTITYNYIIDYESGVMDDTVFTTEERETILTVSSISRYSLYSEEDRKDKDWDILIGNKPAKSFFAPGEASLISIIALLGKLL